MQHNLVNLPQLVGIIDEYRDEWLEENNESGLLHKWREQFNDESYNKILTDINTTIISHHNFSNNNNNNNINKKINSHTMNKQRDNIIKTIRVGISGDLDTYRRLYLDVLQTIYDTFENYKNYSSTNIPTMKLHYTITRGYHICISLGYKNRLNVNNNQIFIEINQKKKIFIVQQHQ